MLKVLQDQKQSPQIGADFGCMTMNVGGGRIELGMSSIFVEWNDQKPLIQFVKV